MKKYRLLSLLLSITLVFSIMSPIHAQEYNKTEIINLTDGLGNKITLKLTNLDDGNIIVSQYLNGTLTVESKVNKNNPNIITEKNYNVNNSNSPRSYSPFNNYTVKKYNMENIIKNTNIKEKFIKNNTYRYYNNQYLGKINYGAITYDGIAKYGLKVYIKNISSIDKTTYTINSYVGSLATLIAAIVGAIKLPEILLATFIRRVLVGYGISVFFGIVSTPFSTTLNAEKTTYTLTLKNKDYEYITKDVKGYRYKITESGHDKLNEEYFEEYAPQKWGEQGFGISAHNELFGYTNFQIESWD